MEIDVNTFVALIEVKEDYYESRSTKGQEIHLVNAKTESEAIDKLKKHYEMKDDEFYVTHYISILSINQLII